MRSRLMPKQLRASSRPTTKSARPTTTSLRPATAVRCVAARPALAHHYRRRSPLFLGGGCLWTRRATHRRVEGAPNQQDWPRAPYSGPCVPYAGEQCTVRSGRCSARSARPVAHPGTSSARLTPRHATPRADCRACTSSSSRTLAVPSKPTRVRLRAEHSSIRIVHKRLRRLIAAADSTFLYTEPQTCHGLWIALEDCAEDNGAPSHTLCPGP